MTTTLWSPSAETADVSATGRRAVEAIALLRDGFHQHDPDVAAYAVTAFETVSRAARVANGSARVNVAHQQNYRTYLMTLSADDNHLVHHPPVTHVRQVERWGQPTGEQLREARGTAMRAIGQLLADTGAQGARRDVALCNLFAVGQAVDHVAAGVAPAMAVIDKRRAALAEKQSRASDRSAPAPRRAGSAAGAMPSHGPPPQVDASREVAALRSGKGGSA